MYEQFDHTADLGLRVVADTLDALFAEAGRALTDALVARPDSIRPSQRRSVRLEAAGYDDLLHDWLAELLYLFEAERLLFRRFEVTLTPGRLAAELWGETFDPKRHEIELEIKAVTYHGLKIEPVPNGWQAEVIVDL